MNQIKCPHCGEVFTVDASGFADILAQVRTQEFEQEIHVQLEKEKELLAVQAEAKVSELKNQLEKSELEKKSISDAKSAEVKLIEEQTKSALQTELSELKAQLQQLESEKQLALQKTVSENEKALAELAKERDAVKNELLLTEKEQELKANAIKNEYEILLKAKNDEVDFYKNFKAQQSTKAIGESLEHFAENEFNKVRATMFPKAYFEKDNDARTGSKGDFIYREND